MNNFNLYKVNGQHNLKDVLAIFEEASKLSLPTGIAIVTNNEEEVIGSITEGDIRRAILNGAKLDSPATTAATPDTYLFFRKILLP